MTRFDPHFNLCHRPSGYNLFGLRHNLVVVLELRLFQNSLILPWLIFGLLFTLKQTNLRLLVFFLHWRGRAYTATSLLRKLFWNFRFLLRRTTFEAVAALTRRYRFGSRSSHKKGSWPSTPLALMLFPVFLIIQELPVFAWECAACWEELASGQPRGFLFGGFARAFASEQEVLN